MDRFDLPSLAPGLETLFDAVADDYDQSGIAFFVPIAAELVRLADPRPRERALDIGCGRGAVTALLSEAVGPEGSVTAFDLSARMVELTAALVPTADVRKLDAQAPELPEGSFDVAAASLVVFFLREPRLAVERWLRLLAPGGRLVLSTFGQVGSLWDSLDGLLRPYVPEHMRDPRLVDPDSPFRTVDRLEALLHDAGAGEVHTRVETISATVTGPEQWLHFSMGTGQRTMWGLVPRDERPLVYDKAAALIEQARQERGSVDLTQEVRYTVARPG